MPVPQRHQAAMDRALEYLGPRARSRRQVDEALERWGYERPVRDGVLTRLEELSILDDAAYAIEAARQGRSRGKGAEGLRRELALQGVGADHIEPAIRETFPPQSEDALALRAAAKRAAGLKGLPPQTQYRRLAGFLTRRGHAPEIVADVCRRVVGDFSGSD